VIDERRRLIGTLTFSDLGAFAFEDGREAPASVSKLAQSNPKVLAEDDDLDAAIEQHLKEREPHLPVVNSREAMQLVGVSHEHAVLAAYQRALKEARAEERGEF
jgi:CIC family chloride channel protein